MFPIVHSKRVGGQNWVKFGPRSYSMPLFRNLVTVAPSHERPMAMSPSVTKAYQNELVHSRGVGGQNWVKFGSRSYLMPPFRDWVTVAPMSVQWLCHQACRKPIRNEP